MKNKIKVVWLAPYPISKIPGIELTGLYHFHPASWIVNLAEELAKKDELELHIVTENSKIRKTKYIVNNNISFHFLNNGVPFTNKGYPSFFPINKFTYYYFNSVRMNLLINKIKPDLIHAHGTETSYAITSLRSRYKSLISIQGIITEISKYDKHYTNRIQSTIELYVVKNARNFACRTNFDKNFVLKNNPQAKIFHLDEAINPIFFQETWKDPKNLNLLFVGSLTEAKGVNVLTQAIAICKTKFPNIHLNLIGNGSEKFRMKIEKFVKENKLEKNIVFMGSQSSDIIKEKLLSSQIFILPTLVDNSPNSLAEAMAVGTPCIASNVGGIPTLLKDESEGLLVEPNQPLSLAEKIINLLNDSEKRKILSTNARKVAYERHLPNKVAEKTIEVYKNIINE